MKREYILLIGIIGIIGLSCQLSAGGSVYDTWVGNINILDHDIEMVVELIADDEQDRGYLTIPVQGLRNHPFAVVKIDDKEVTLHFTSGGVTAYFEGIYDGDSIQGEFRQEGQKGEFSLVRGERSEAPTRELMPGESSIHVSTRFGNLYGNLLMPAETDPVPLVLIIAGSGPTDRDGNNPMMGQSNIYRNLALKLQENNIASVRYDKRGIGESSGALLKEEDLRFNYFVTDVIEWIRKLNQDDRFSSLILLGHSEGSLLALLAANEEPVDGVISVAGMGRNMVDVLRDQLSRQPEPQKSQALEVLEELGQGRMVREVPDDLKTLFRVEIQPFLLTMFRHNPAEAIAQLDIPVQIIQGTQDLQVKEVDAEKLHAANPDSDLVIIEGMNHVMRDGGSDEQQNIMTYSRPDLPFSNGFIEHIISFIEGL